MKRRRFLAGLGITAASSSFAVGSGAFSSIEAGRTVTVETASDKDAYLRLNPVDTNYADRVDGQFVLNFDDDFGAIADDDHIGDGPGTDSTYEFDEVFIVENQGTNPIQVYSVYDGNGLSAIETFESSDDDREALTENNLSSEIGTGDGVALGVRLDTTDASIKSHDEVLTIHAKKA